MCVHASVCVCVCVCVCMRLSGVSQQLLGKMGKLIRARMKDSV